MQNSIFLGDDLYYIGGSDRKLALFESVFPLKRGVSYNSYLLMDEKTVLFDTVDRAVSDIFFENLKHVLGKRKLDYLVIHHMEPDHSACFLEIVKRYPTVKVIVNAKISVMLSNFYGKALPELIEVKDGDTLGAGRHTLRFLFAPMVHWPEVTFSFDEATGTLFSADAFGSFGALDGGVFADEVHFERDYLDEARRYYFNIVGKYGVQVQNALKKVAALDIKRVCPLHGPVWRRDFKRYLDKYDIWSSYRPETKGVAVFYASIYGHTKNAAEILAGALAGEGVQEIKVYNVSETETSELLAEAFRFSHCVFLSPTYNAGVFVNMQRFLTDLTEHNFQNRAFSIVESGSWSPQAGRLMREQLSACKNMREVGTIVSFLSSVKEETREQLCSLAKAIALDVNR